MSIRNVQTMTSDEILTEIREMDEWLESIKGEELGGGSPLEWHYERLEELETEYLRRIPREF